MLRQQFTAVYATIKWGPWVRHPNRGDLNDQDALHTLQTYLLWINYPCSLWLLWLIQSLAMSEYIDNVMYSARVSSVTLLYCRTQNFWGRNFWWNSSHQKSADNILANAQSYQSTQNNDYMSTFYRSFVIIGYCCGVGLK